MKRSGQPSRREVVRFPRDPSSRANDSDQYEAAVVAADRVHVSVGVSPTPGMLVTVHALPPSFPLAVAFVETLVSPAGGFRYGGGAAGAGACVSAAVLVAVAEFLAGFLWRSDVAGVLKEYMFQLLAQCVRVGRASGGELAGRLVTTAPLFARLRQEVLLLYEAETRTGGVPHAPPRFSTYFQSLLELCLAVCEVGGTGVGHVPLTHSRSAPDTRDAHAAGQDGEASRTPSRTASRPARLSETQLATSGGSLAGSGSSSGSSVTLDARDSGEMGVLAGHGRVELSSVAPSSKEAGSSRRHEKEFDESLWFQRALTVSQILRQATGGSTSGGRVVMTDAVADAARSLAPSSAHRRVLLVSGLSPRLAPGPTRATIQRVINAHGGLQGQVYLPLTPDGAIRGDAVIQLRCAAKMDGATTSLLTALTPLATPDSLAVHPLDPNLTNSCAIHDFLLEKLLSPDDVLTAAATDVFTEVYRSGCGHHRSQWAGLGRRELANTARSNLLHAFIELLRPVKTPASDHIAYILNNYGSERPASKQDRRVTANGQVINSALGAAALRFRTVLHGTILNYIILIGC